MRRSSRRSARATPPPRADWRKPASANPSGKNAMTRNVGVIGLGAMGMGVARSLLRAGFAVHACDVRPDVLDAFAKEGGIACASPAELGGKCEVVLTVVVNAAQTE